MDTEYVTHGRGLRLEMLKSKNIDDMARAARTEVPSLNSVAPDDISIWKILEPIPYKSQYNLRSSEQRLPPQASGGQGRTATAPQSIDDLVERLKKGDRSCIEDLDPREKVVDHFKEDILDIQVIVLHPVLEGESYLIYDVR